jgi:hypothetical protein
MATRIRIMQNTRSETRVPGGRRIVLDFREEDGDSVPAILLLPDTETAAPGALLLHGYSSRKEHMADNVGRALLAEGIASLSIDLPLHGDRGDPLQAQSARNPLAAVRLWRAGLGEAKLAVRSLGARKEVDGERLGVAGYSLGSFLAVALAAGEPRIRAVVVAAGGDLPSGTPLATVARTVVDPTRAVRKLAPRPLLMVHGRDDRTVRPDQAERLYAAAGEPKELRWYAAGHYLPTAAIQYVAGWLRERL